MVVVSRQLFSLLAIGLFSLCACKKPADTTTVTPTPTTPTTPVMAPSAGLEVAIRADGVSIGTPSGSLREGCIAGAGVTVPRAQDGRVDFDAVTRCARTAKTNEPRLRTSGIVQVNAANETPYADVIALLDAVRKDGAGDLFPEVTFGLPAPPPPHLTHSRPPPVTASSATPQPLTVPSPEEEGTIVLVSKSQIVVSDERVLEYPGPESARAHGLAASFKKDGEADYFIVPLADRLAKERFVTQQLRAAKGIDASRAYEIILIADATIPYRLLREVLYTATESGFDKYHLMVLQKAK